MKSLTLAAFLLLVIPAAANAAGKCKLSRPPFLLSEALPSALECKFDQDGNGLDDEVEREIAKCVAPAIQFDSAEQHAAPGEPHALFTATPQSATDIKFRFVYLFAQDGGPVLSGWPCTTNSHAGDTQPVGVSVKITKALSGWYAEPYAEIDGQPLAMLGTHPKVYATAGKHHFKAQSGWYEYGAGCDDRADGLGALVFVGGPGNPSLGHLPAMQTDPLSGNEITIAPLSAGKWVNACRYIEHGQLTLATGFQPNNLSNLGYPGQFVMSDEFYDADAVSYHVRQPWNADPDGDGQRSGYYRIGSNLFAPTDSCPWVAGNPHTDQDGDGIGNGCDPDEFSRNVYVAGGDANFPAYDDADFPGPWIAKSGAPTGPRGGFLDLDQDGRVRGDDLCPASAPLYASNQNRNAWGELENEKEAPGLVTYYRDRGRLDRADRCDPYPATSLEFDAGTNQPTHTSGGPCSLWNSKSFGDSTVAVDVALNVGISDDDPILDQSNPSPSPETYRVQVYRCACVGYAGAACLDDPASDCYRNDVTAGGPSVGRGWRPVHRAGCTLDRSGWCQPFTMSVTPGNTTSTTIVWEWASERVDHPNHFAPGDFVTSGTIGPMGPSGIPGTVATHAHSEHAYVLWAQVETGYDFVGPPGPHPHAVGSHSAVWPDPETVDWWLNDVNSTRSRRLRASFALPQYLSEPYSVTHFNGYLCSVIGTIKALEKFWLPRWPDFQEVFASSLPYVRLLASAGDAFVEHAILEPEQGTGYSMSAPSWVGASEGMAALIAGAPHTIAQTAAAMNEPAVLWVETAATQRWAFLVPTGFAGSVMSYAIAYEGTLPGEGALVGDELGANAALVDLSRARGWLFDPTLGDFAAEVDLSSVANRSQASIALVGTDLFVAGGLRAGRALNDVWRAPLAGAAPTIVSTALPTRLGADLALAPGGGSLLLFGGADATGAMHDDVHRLDLGASGTVTSVRLASPDTASAPSLIPAESVLYGTNTQVRAQGAALLRTPRAVAP